MGQHLVVMNVLSSCIAKILQESISHWWFKDLIIEQDTALPRHSTSVLGNPSHTNPPMTQILLDCLSHLSIHPTTTLLHGWHKLSRPNQKLS